MILSMRRILRFDSLKPRELLRGREQSDLHAWPSAVVIEECFGDHVGDPLRRFVEAGSGLKNPYEAVRVQTAFLVCVIFHTQRDDHDLSRNREACLLVCPVRFAEAVMEEERHPFAGLQAFQDFVLPLSGDSDARVSDPSLDPVLKEGYCDFANLLLVFGQM